LDNPPNPPQDTNPPPPVIPPVGVPGDPTVDPNLPPPDQQVNTVSITGTTTTTGDPIPNTTEFLQQQQAQQQRQAQQQQQSSGMTTGSLGPQPIRLDVGENRYFYLPPPGETRLVVNEVVLQMPCNVPQATLDAILKQHNLSVVASQCLQEGGGNAAFRMRHANDQTIAAVIRALAQHQIIAAAQANYLYTLAETKVQSATSQQGDPGQYVPEKLHLYSVHRQVRGANVPVAVIDSEIDAAHPDITGTIANRYDATGVEDAPHAHGTGMAGAIVSHQRLLGVAPDARILAIRAFSTRATNSESTTYHILRGIDHAVANNVRIINMSFAGPRDPSLERAIKVAYDKGIVMIAAAGNAGPRSPALYPAADPNVIAVTATDMDDRLFTGANRGPHVAIAAPGVDILVPAPSGEYQVTTGTSVATAHVSGVVALMLERNPKLNPADVRRILAASAKRLGPPNQFGAGLIDPARAIEMAAPRSSTGPAAPTAPPKRTAATRQ
jgi:subtilisin family serine protease